MYIMRHFNNAILICSYVAKIRVNIYELYLRLDYEQGDREETDKINPVKICKGPLAKYY